jgi:ankyrin repeat protein
MFRAEKVFLLAISFLCIGFTSPIFALEKERLLTCLKEYAESKEKWELHWGKLHYAIEYGYPDVAEFLINKGEPITVYRTDLSSKDMKHPLMTVIEKGYKDIAINLIHHIDFSSKDGSLAISVFYLLWHEDLQIYPLSFQIMLEEKDRFEIIEALLLAGIDENVSNNILIDAIILRKLQIAKLLLDHIANDVEGLNAETLAGLLDCAIYPTPWLKLGPSIDAVNMLLGYGADPLTVLNGTTRLELAIHLAQFYPEYSSVYVDIIDLFLEVAVKS